MDCSSVPKMKHEWPSKAWLRTHEWLLYTYHACKLFELLILKCSVMAHCSVSPGNKCPQLKLSGLRNMCLYLSWLRHSWRCHWCPERARAHSEVGSSPKNVVFLMVCFLRGLHWRKLQPSHAHRLIAHLVCPYQKDTDTKLAHKILLHSLMIIGAAITITPFRSSRVQLGNHDKVNGEGRKAHGSVKFLLMSLNSFHYPLELNSDT